MFRMRSVVVMGLMLVGLSAFGAKLSQSVPRGWCEDYTAAKVQAEKEGKFILAAVSGSDWCPWCVKMERETFSQPLFVREASKKYVLLYVDNPQDTEILSPLAKKQNRALTKELGVRGFPSVVIVDAKGKPVKRHSGYVAGGPKSFLAELDTLMKDVTWPKPVATVAK